MPVLPVALDIERTKPLEVNSRNSDGSAGPNFPISVHLIAAGSEHPDVFSSIEGGPDHPSVAVRGIEPGRYRPEIRHSWGDQWYIASAICGDTDLFREELTVLPGDSRVINVVMRDNGATLQGTVQPNLESAAATVVIVPDASPLNIVSLQSNDRGQFQVGGLAPGNYKVFAFDHVEKFEFANPDVLGDYVGRAAQIDLQPNEKGSVEVELIHVKGY
jgi:hypothetical protein